MERHIFHFPLIISHFSLDWFIRVISQRFSVISWIVLIET